MRSSLLLLILLLGSADPAFGSNNLRHYRRERDRLEAQLQAKRRELGELSRRLDEKNAEKARVVEAARSDIRTKGERLGRQVEGQLSEVRTTFQRLREATDRYLREQARSMERLKELVARHESHRSTESTVRANLREIARRIQTAAALPEILDRNAEVERILLQERTVRLELERMAGPLRERLIRADMRYVDAIRPHLETMRRWEFPEMGPPTEPLARIDGILSYADARFSNLEPLCLQLMEDASRRLEDLLRQTELRQRTDHERAAQHEADKLRFLESVRASLRKLRESRSGRYLLPEYEAYSEILGYRSVCAALPVLRAEDHAHFAGCQVLQEPMREAERYLERLSWSKLGVSLLQIEGLDESLRSRWEELQRLRWNHESPHVPVIEAIRRHDALVRDHEALASGGGAT